VTPTIRPATAADLPAVAEIHAYYVLETVKTFDVEPLPLAAWEEKLADAGAAGHPWLVAVDDGGDVVGFVAAGPYRARASYAPTVELSIYLRPEVHGRGLGTRLYAAILPELSARGFHRAMGGVTLPNPASSALHEAAGFHLVGVLDEVGHKHGAYHSVGWWIRKL
jgi:L-amino acid N-acyltransferase YncA